jgi:hypothetical protein
MADAAAADIFAAEVISLLPPLFRFFAIFAFDYCYLRFRCFRFAASRHYAAELIRR